MVLYGIIWYYMVLYGIIQYIDKNKSISNINTKNINDE